MMKFFKTNKSDIEKEWNSKGENYADGINKMVEFGEKNGWENWNGKEPEDDREHLTDEVIRLLKEANTNNDSVKFRESFPPSHTPIIPFLEKRAQSIEQLHFIDGQRIVFLTGTSYEKRKAYLLDGDKPTELDSTIIAIGKSKRNNVFAIAYEDKISTFQGWEGELIREFPFSLSVGITEIIPFNDGNKLVIVTSEGIFLLSGNEKRLIHPLYEDGEEDEASGIDMENATLSNDNLYIVVGDQCYDHRVLDSDGNLLGNIGPQSSYPHYCLFSKDDSQLITNSCHFYNGITIGVNYEKLNGIDVEAYEESKDYVVINEEMRVYCGLATSDYYILGDAYGYIKAVDKNGKKIWRHFLGSTVSGMAISDDEKVLWVGSSSGILHKLILGKGHRDNHTIGNGNHYEEFRLLIWKGEEKILKW